MKIKKIGLKKFFIFINAETQDSVKEKKK